MLEKGAEARSEFFVGENDVPDVEMGNAHHSPGDDVQLIEVDDGEQSVEEEARFEASVDDAGVPDVEMGDYHHVSGVGQPGKGERG